MSGTNSTLNRCFDIYFFWDFLFYSLYSSGRYLRRIQVSNKLDRERVIDRVGFLFEPYREEYLYYDVVYVTMQSHELVFVIL